MLQWLSNSACGVFPCQVEVDVVQTFKDKAGKERKVTRKQMVDNFLVVTENIFLMLKTDTKIKNVAKMQAWATLASLEKIKHSLEYNDQITMQWRRLDDARPAWVLSVMMNQNSNECVTLIMRNLKQAGITSTKAFEKKRKIRESEVTQASVSELKIDALLRTIEEWEGMMGADKSAETVQHLMALYNKAVIYYSALNDDKH